MSISENINTLKSKLPNEVVLVAVSKTKTEDDILQAYSSGHRVFGENKVQELIEKFEALPKDIEWHMIGHLQRNKVKYIAPFVSLIHAVDTEKLLREINKQGKKIDRKIPCLLQVHIAEEETKFGFDYDEIEHLLNSNILIELPFVLVSGLMAMATNTDINNQVSTEFKKLKSFFDQCQKKHHELNILSIGMSGDYTLAVEAGSTMIRVGSAIFGSRNV